MERLWALVVGLANDFTFSLRNTIVLPWVLPFAQVVVPLVCTTRREEVFSSTSNINERGASGLGVTARGHQLRNDKLAFILADAIVAFCS